MPYTLDQDLPFTLDQDMPWTLDQDWVSEMPPSPCPPSNVEIIVCKPPEIPTSNMSLIIGDDYFEPRAPVWWIDPPDAVLAESEFWFGIGGQSIQGSIFEDTVDGNPKWKLVAGLPRSFTGQFKPGRYGFSLELRKPLTSASDKHVTVLRGDVEMLEKFT